MPHMGSDLGLETRSGGAGRISTGAAAMEAAAALGVLDNRSAELADQDLDTLPDSLAGLVASQAPSRARGRWLAWETGRSAVTSPPSSSTGHLLKAHRAVWGLGMSLWTGTFPLMWQVSRYRRNSILAHRGNSRCSIATRPTALRSMTTPSPVCASN